MTHPLSPLVDTLLRRENGIVAAAILKLAMEFNRVELKDGVLGVEIPVGHPHWPLVNQLDIRHELAAAGREMGVEVVELVPTRREHAEA